MPPKIKAVIGDNIQELECLEKEFSYLGIDLSSLLLSLLFSLLDKYNAHMMPLKIKAVIEGNIQELEHLEKEFSYLGKLLKIKATLPSITAFVQERRGERRERREREERKEFYTPR
jgi:hypothetical protein